MTRASFVRLAGTLALAVTPFASTAQNLSLPPDIAREISPIGRRLDPSILPPLTSTEKRWDFEDGTLQGFTIESVEGFGGTNSFDGQPTFGENVSAPRALNSSGAAFGPNPCEGLFLDVETTCLYGRGAIFQYYSALRNELDRLREDLAVLGGDFAAGPFPIGKQGKYWIGTFENRPSRRATLSRSMARATVWGGVRGDAPQGRLASPTVDLNTKYFSVLVGGGCSNEVGVYLQTLRTVLRRSSPQIDSSTGRPLTNPGVVDVTPAVEWRTLVDADGAPIAARGVCLENMVRRTFDISAHVGVKARILIEDRSSGAWGHINVDDILLTNRAPKPTTRATDPVWGVADLHAHLMNEKAYAAYDAIDAGPEARALWGSVNGPIENLRPDNDTHTTIGNDFASVQDLVNGSTYTLCRDLCINLLEGAGLPEVDGDQVDQGGLLGGFHSTDGGYPNFRDWPMWYSATHQQMHWTWVKRAYQGGLRLMIASVGNSEVVSFAMAKEKERPFSSDQDALATEIPAIKEFARQNADWAQIAYTPQEARRVINSGKLAIIIGVELDHVMDNCSADVTSPRHHRAREYSHPDVWLTHSGLDLDLATGIVGGAHFLGLTSSVMHYPDHPRTCSAAQIQARIDALYRQGVRQIIPMHFSNNMLGGYAITGGLFVASAIFGSPDALPPTLQNEEELERNYGSAAAAFHPVAREAYYGENNDRRRDWSARRPIQNKLEDISIPIWVRLQPDAILDPTIVPPGIGRNIVEFFMGRCISDDGWRAFAAFFSGGLSEAACAVSTITSESIDAVRSTLPYEGATDSPAMIPVSPTGAMEERPFHVNALDLTDNGGVFIREMMRRGMMIDIQHASDLAKNEILAIAGAYPVMASHGGAQSTGPRPNENTLSRGQLNNVYAPPDGFAPGIIGVGVQSGSSVIDQMRLAANVSGAAAADRELRAVALGTDINGMDWHAPPRFGKYALYGLTPTERRQFRRDGDLRPRVNYAAYPAGTSPWAATTPTCDPACPDWNLGPVSSSPALNALQIMSGTNTTRTFDINYDGLAQYGLIPDFLQELRVLGAAPEEMGALYKSSEGLLTMWEENCYLAHHMPSPPPSLSMGCGARGDYD